MTEREALKLALEALVEMTPSGLNGSAIWHKQMSAITAASEALAQPEQKPVAHCTIRPLRGDEFYPKTEIIWVKGRPVAGPLYTTPPQRTWVGLTPQERDEINEQVYGAVPHHVAFHAAIEAKLKEKNT